MDPSRQCGDAGSPAAGAGSCAWFQAAARFRQGAYRLLAEVFQPPEAGSLQTVRKAAGVLRGMRDDVSALAFASPVDAWLRVLERPSPLAPLRVRYYSLFGSGAGEGRVSLRESGYRQQRISDPGSTIGSLQSLYARTGLRHASAGTSPDHVSVELTFASLMCRDEASAWAEGAGTEVRKALLWQQLFLGRHLFRWLPLMAREVVRHDDGLYAATANAAWALVSHDVDFVRACQALVRDAAPHGQPAGIS